MFGVVKSKYLIKFIFAFLSLLFVLFSFYPSVYEIQKAKNLPAGRSFVLEHNYMFDYNFYLSRIREGQEGKWTVTEKYYNQPHVSSLFQVLYLYLGKLGGVFKMPPPVVYHASRLVFGFLLLYLIGQYFYRVFKNRLAIIGYLLTVTAGSWPILAKVGGSFRLATYMGWWSVIDSLQRITFIPHVIFGQLFILIFLWQFSEPYKLHQPLKLFAWGVTGFLVGIVFPPTLVIVYTALGILSLMEMVMGREGEKLFKSPGEFKNNEWITNKIIPRLVFILISIPSFLYVQMMFKVTPWNALAIFDVNHRTPIPYTEYFLALGPILPFGLLGGLWAIYKKTKMLFPAVGWVIAIFLLFYVFSFVPMQSPLRFTEGAIHIPLGILASYMFYELYRQGKKLLKTGVIVVMLAMVILGLSVMGSMVFWLTDQADAKALSTWKYPLGTRLVYPLTDFMSAIHYLRSQTDYRRVVLALEAAGNYIPAYSGNYVYLGHANTPFEDEKVHIAEQFFAGKMKVEEAKEFLRRERISYLFYGPQEKETGNIADLSKIMPFTVLVYQNNQVIIYQIKL